VHAGVADEGGWWPNFGSNEEAVDALVRGVGAAGFSVSSAVVLSMDIAASELWIDDTDRLALERRQLTSDAMVELISRW
jgi:enolase